MAKRVIVQRYKNEREYQRDAQKWAKRGYQVISVTSQQPRSGIGRIILTGGIGAIAFKPKPVLIVTYQLIPS